MIEQLTPEEKLALAQIRVSLAELAPEIPETEIIPEANLEQDLRLDITTHWVLACSLEQMTKQEFADAQIRQCQTVADLIALVVSPEDNVESATELPNDIFSQLDVASE
ncbi:MAG: hypothetical protein SPG61_03865 [Arcanobacterium sp.]|nr:hypothetical protein [Arcanobacterium sp.]